MEATVQDQGSRAFAPWPGAAAEEGSHVSGVSRNHGRNRDMDRRRSYRDRRHLRGGRKHASERPPANSNRQQKS